MDTNTFENRVETYNERNTDGINRLLNIIEARLNIEEG